MSFLTGLFLFFISRARLLSLNFRSTHEKSIKLGRLPKARLPQLKRAQDSSTACISCGLCVDYCPTQALRLEGEAHAQPNSFELNQLGCVECTICIKICPVDALELGREVNRVVFYPQEEWLAL